MFAFLSQFISSGARERERAKELMEIENNFLDNDDELNKVNELDSNSNQNIIDNRKTKSSGNAIDKDSDSASGTSDINGIENSTPCSRRKGLVTHLTTTNGMIDEKLAFGKEIAAMFQELCVGSLVEYLVYKTEANVNKVVKIENIIDQSWEQPSVSKTQDMLDSLRLDKPKYFNTNQRNICGVVKERHASSIEVETHCGALTIKLDDTEITFIPRKGDEVRLECNVQLDEDYVDQQGEILEVLKVLPTRIQIGQKCVVKRVFESFSELSGEAYVFKADLPIGIDLHLGDIVKADLIECSFESKFNKYSLRAIKVAMLEKNFGNVKQNLPNTSTNTRAMQIEGKDRLIYSELWKKDTVTFKLKNNTNNVQTLRKVIIKNDANAQISVVEPLNSREIDEGGQISVVLEVHTKFIGESDESFTLVFDNFKFNRPLKIVVCETELEAKQAELRLLASDSLNVVGKTVAQRSGFYANQVWSSKNAVVPGEFPFVKRRFVKKYLEMFDVPKSLRELVLCSEKRGRMVEILNNYYPFLKGPLTMDNYKNRFGLLLHLEEIEYTINIRNFDRERAHFQRDGEFLSLHIEDLAERRPSIVIGDSIRATNPFVGPEAKSFEGIVHKVLFNRVLLKFNAGFHEKYNGEDYRVTFHFSRLSLRKQHHSIGAVVRSFGEQFLFPNKVNMRENPQLEVMFKDDHMHLYDDKLPWYNTSLNSIQKRAVFNILRGEADSMPYIIFGPPGTGKTVTLVETVLQLVRNLPGARLLIGTPSNSSADLITKRLIDSKALAQGDFIRLVSMNHIEKDMIPEELKSYCATGDNGISNTCKDGMIVTDSGLKLRCQSKFLILHRVIISTCSTLGNFLQMDIPPGHFTHVLIDEAGQCSEPETVVPIALLRQRNSQVILAGDPHQLPAMVLDRRAGDYGLRVSLLERLLERSPYCKDLERFPENSGYNPFVLTKLLNNYRALPSVMCVYSKLFYDNELISMVSSEDSREALLLADVQKIFDLDDSLPVPLTHGTFFHAILGENLQDNDSPSWYNPAEARQVFLTTILLYRRNVNPDQIGILTPYSKQVKAIRSMFISADIAMPKIGTVEEFQGQERDIMLISTVRSAQAVLQSDARLNMGFVHCKKRMNVATSRARSLMVVFGNPDLLSLDNCWSQLIVYCCNNNSYFGCDLPKRLRPGADQEDDGNLSDNNDFVP